MLSPARPDHRIKRTPANSTHLVALGCFIMALVFVSGVHTGCKSSEKSGSSSSSSPSRSGSGSSTGATGGMSDPVAAAKLEAEFVIGPEAARELDSRVDWQYPQAGKNLRNVWMQGDSVFTLDGENLVTRILLKGGNRLWRVAVADRSEEIHGLNFIGDHVYVASGGAIIVLDANTGAQTGKQTLEKLANTQPVVHGQFLIYGSRGGQAIWHSYPVGYMWKGYQVAPSIEITPVLNGDRLAMVGNDGTVMVLNAAHATQYWSKKLLSAVKAAPAVGKDAVYVAGTDQYVWAYDINNGRTIWRTLTESPLTSSPVHLGEFVYQQVPSRGLVCFEALPLDSPGGRVAWTATGQAGSVVMRRRDQLYVWDDVGKTLTILEAKRGGFVKSLELPKVKFLIVPDPSGANAEIIAADNDGRVVHLVPRN